MALLQFKIRTVLEYALPPGTVGDPYSTNLTASGGSGGYRWELLSRSGVLSWLTLNKDTGVLSGQPDTATAGAVSLTFI